MASKLCLRSQETFGAHGGVRFTVGHDDFKGLFQSKQVSDSVILINLFF